MLPSSRNRRSRSGLPGYVCKCGSNASICHLCELGAGLLVSTTLARPDSKAKQENDAALLRAQQEIEEAQAGGPKPTRYRAVSVKCRWEHCLQSPPEFLVIALSWPSHVVWLCLIHLQARDMAALWSIAGVRNPSTLMPVVAPDEPVPGSASSGSGGSMTAMQRERAAGAVSAALGRGAQKSSGKGPMAVNAISDSD